MAIRCTCCTHSLPGEEGQEQTCREVVATEAPNQYSLPPEPSLPELCTSTTGLGPNHFSTKATGWVWPPQQPCAVAPFIFFLCLGCLTLAFSHCGNDCKTEDKESRQRHPEEALASIEGESHLDSENPPPPSLLPTRRASLRRILSQNPRKHLVLLWRPLHPSTLPGRHV